MVAAPALGLEANLRKCELVLPGTMDQPGWEAAFPQSLLVDDLGQARVKYGHLELLGAAIGDRDFCEAHTSARVGTAQLLLTEITDMQDPQVALRLFRACASFSKISYSTRCVPSNLQAKVLADFDSSSGRFCGILWASPGRRSMGSSMSGSSLRWPWTAQRGGSRPSCIYRIFGSVFQHLPTAK